MKSNGRNKQNVQNDVIKQLIKDALPAFIIAQYRQQQKKEKVKA